MCIVLALITIIGTMVASFCVMTGNYTKLASSDRDVVESIAMLEDALSKWVSAFDADGYGITISPDKSTMTAVNDSDSSDIYTFKLENGVIKGELPGTREIRYSAPALKSLSLEGPAGDSGVLKCDATYIRKKYDTETEGTVTILRSTKRIHNWGGA